MKKQNNFLVVQILSLRGHLSADNDPIKEVLRNVQIIKKHIRADLTLVFKVKWIAILK